MAGGTRPVKRYLPNTIRGVYKSVGVASDGGRGHFDIICGLLFVCLFVCLFLQAVVPALSGVLQGFMMNGVVGVVCPDLQDGLLSMFAEVDPPNSRVGVATSTCTRTHAHTHGMSACLILHAIFSLLSSSRK